MRKSVRAVAAALLTAAVSAGSAQAATECLYAYELKLKADRVEDLARAGYDVTEGRVGNRITVVGTAAAAGELRKLGFNPRVSKVAARVTIKAPR